MVTTKAVFLNLVNCMPDSDFSKLCSLINDYIERKQAEDRFFKEMDIVEKSVAEEETISSKELRKSLGI